MQVVQVMPGGFPIAVCKWVASDARSQGSATAPIESTPALSAKDSQVVENIGLSLQVKVQVIRRRLQVIYPMLARAGRTRWTSEGRSGHTGVHGVYDVFRFARQGRA